MRKNGWWGRRRKEWDVVKSEIILVKGGAGNKAVFWTRAQKSSWRRLWDDYKKEMLILPCSVLEEEDTSRLYLKQKLLTFQTWFNPMIVGGNTDIININLLKWCIEGLIKRPCNILSDNQASRRWKLMFGQRTIMYLGFGEEIKAGVVKPLVESCGERNWAEMGPKCWVGNACRWDETSRWMSYQLKTEGGRGERGEGRDRRWCFSLLFGWD